jgi:hypothetical protein
MSAVADALTQPALTVDGRAYTVADVAVAALWLGEWSGLQARAAAGIAVDAGAHDPPPAHDVEATAEAFRRGRQLLAAEDIESWLHRRGLSAGEWMRWVRMDVARRAAPGAATDGVPSADALYAEAICSGALARAGRWLAEVLVSPRPRSPGGPSRLPDPSRLAPLGIDTARAREVAELLRDRRSAVQELGEAVAGPEAIAGRVRAMQAEWLLVDYRVLSLDAESAAREALLCIRDDGMTMEETAELAGGDVAHEHALLADVPDEVQAQLLSASRGELVGPLAAGTRSAVMVVDAKVAPSPDDPEVARRAKRDLLVRALEREISARVEWHDRL